MISKIKISSCVTQTRFRTLRRYRLSSNGAMSAYQPQLDVRSPLMKTSQNSAWILTTTSDASSIQSQAPILSWKPMSFLRYCHLGGECKDTLRRQAPHRELQVSLCMIAVAIGEPETQLLKQGKASSYDEQPSMDRFRKQYQLGCAQKSFKTPPF